MKIKISIGDWSEDGHNQYEQFVFESNKPVEEIQQAYKDSCKLTGLQFNHNEDYTGLNLNWQHPEYDDRQICTEYEDGEVSQFAKDILSTHGLDVPEDFYEEEFLQLLIDFIKLSLPDLELVEASFKRSELKEIPALNGWWNDNLNVQFGYGLYE